MELCYKCEVCKKSGAQYRCGNCKNTCYCSLACQKQDWQTHSQFCISEQELIRVDENLYYKNDDKLTFVMERLTTETINPWLFYANMQSDPDIVKQTDRRMFSKEKLSKDLGGQGLTARAGVAAFRSILQNTFNDLSFGRHPEVWIAYVATKHQPISIPTSIKKDRYHPQMLPNEFTERIIMFTTVSTTQEALLASPMGICVSYENAATRPKGISLKLHAFWAQVLLMRNPLKRYMLTTPVRAMREILVQKLPKEAVSVGTLEGLRDARAMFDVWMKTHLVSAMEENPPRVSLSEKKGVIFDKHGKVEFEWDRQSETYKWLMCGDFEQHGMILFVLVDLKVLSQQ